MSRLRKYSTVFFSALLLSILFLGASANATYNFTISGTVYDAMDNDELQNILVEVLNTDDSQFNPPLSDLTDLNGEFSISGTAVDMHSMVLLKLTFPYGTAYYTTWYYGDILGLEMTDSYDLFYISSFSTWLSSLDSSFGITTKTAFIAGTAMWHNFDQYGNLIDSEPVGCATA